MSVLICLCGHKRSEHGELGGCWHGHNAADLCKCMQFRPAEPAPEIRCVRADGCAYPVSCAKNSTCLASEGEAEPAPGSGPLPDVPCVRREGCKRLDCAMHGICLWKPAPESEQTLSGGEIIAEKAKGVAGWTQAQRAPKGAVVEILPNDQTPPLKSSEVQPAVEPIALVNELVRIMQWVSASLAQAYEYDVDLRGSIQVACEHLSDGLKLANKTRHAAESEVQPADSGGKTPEQMRVEIARLCGWEQEWWDYERGEKVLKGYPRIDGQLGDEREYIPDYPACLDAMALAEATLSGIEEYRYVLELNRVMFGPEASPTWPPMFEIVHANAEARAKAFLAVKGASK